MATGKEHFEAYKDGNVFIFPWFIALVISSFVIRDNPMLLVIQGVLLSAAWQYIIVCRYIDPDLDHITITDSESRMRKELPIIGYVFVLYWTVYAAMLNIIAVGLGISHGRLGAHRSILSHSYFGTIGRMVWFNIPVIIIANVWNDVMTVNDLPQYVITWTSSITLYYFIGQLFAILRADSIHYKMDELS